LDVELCRLTSPRDGEIIPGLRTGTTQGKEEPGIRATWTTTTIIEVDMKTTMKVIREMPGIVMQLRVTTTAKCTTMAVIQKEIIADGPMVTGVTVAAGGTVVGITYDTVQTQDAATVEAARGAQAETLEGPATQLSWKVYLSEYRRMRLVPCPI
jgi:hypothetical protein